MLKCECGGAVVCQDGTDPDAGPPFVEQYECQTCGRTGSYTFGDGGTEHTSGCVTIEPATYPGY